MQPLHNIDRIVQAIQTAPESLGQLIKINSAFLSTCQNPAAATKLEALAERVSHISIEDARTLKSYAADCRLPSEIMNLIVAQVGTPKEIGALSQASVETRKQALAAYKGPLKAIGRDTAEKVIAFAREFPGLTSIDISNIVFPKEQIDTLFSLLPNLKSFKATGIEFAHSFTNLESLVLRRCRVDVQAIAGLENLRALHLENCSIDNEDVTTIANSPKLSNLQTLNLHDNHINDRGATAIASSQHLKNLKTLRLGNDDDYHEECIKEAGACALAHSPFLTNLQSLDLQCCKIGIAGIKAIAGLSNLRALYLNGCKIGQEGAHVIATSPALSRLHTLDLSSNGLKADGATILAQSETLESLKSLNLNINHIGNNGAKSLAASPIFKNLQSIDLYFNLIFDAGAKAIAASPYFTKLQSLNLWANGLEDEGAKAIANSNTLRNLQKLNLRCNHLRVEGVRALARSQTLKNLVELILNENYQFKDPGILEICTSRTLKNARVEVYLTDFEDLGKYALSQRKKLSRLSEDQWQQLLKSVCGERDEDWAKQHLFDDRERFERALGDIEKNN